MLGRFGGQEGGINDSTLILYVDTSFDTFLSPNLFDIAG